MDEIEFLPTTDVAAQDEIVVAPRPRWRRWGQPAALLVLAAAGTTLVLIHPDARHPATQTRLGPVPTVHIQTYRPWHERAITGGGGAYIF